MVSSPIALGLIAAFVCIVSPLFASDAATRPASQPAAPARSQEAMQLLAYLRGISGNHTLTGQHCNPLVGSTRLLSVEKVTGKYPAVFGQDFGFSEPGTWDN